MSSTRKQTAPAGKPGKPERKAPSGPVITPQVLGIVFGIILVIGLVVYYQSVVVKFNSDIAALENEKNSLSQKKRTYETKRDKLDQARNLNLALREKLSLIDYLFLYNQDSILPFFEDTMFPIIEGGTLMIGSDSVIEMEPFVFQINMAMQPFATLPRSRLFEDAVSLFPVEYHGEKNGVPTDTVLNTQPPTFLEPYHIDLVDFEGTYEDVKRFIEDVQTAEDDILITVHCLKSDGDPWGLFRSYSKWTIKMTVYFMNPEESANGDNPPAPPGSQTC